MAWSRVTAGALRAAAGRHRWIRAAAAFALLPVMCSHGAAAVASPGQGAAAGVYAGPADPSAVRRFERWSGEPISDVVEFTARDTWLEISQPWFINQVWSAGSTTFRDQTLVLSVPMLPGDGGSLAWGARGYYNWHFRQLAEGLRDQKLASRTIVRLGWEFNSGWAAWSSAGDPKAYAEFFRQVVTTMRAVAPSLRFDWCPSEGLGQFWGVPGGLAAAYPGNRYVDYIGMDVYDQAWGPNGSIISNPAMRWQQLVNEPGGLAWQAQFAARHDKPMSFPEWALTKRDDGHGGGDDPYFIQEMHTWITSHNVAYQSYFELDAPDGLHSLESGLFPAAAAAFRQEFGSGARA